MLPRRPANLFRSRWAALLWAVGVLWTAVTVSGVDFGGAAKPTASQEDTTDALGRPVDNADLAVLRNFIGG